MKRLAAVLLVGVLLALALPGTGLAYSGIEGTVFDANGNAWAYGGQVYLLQKNEYPGSPPGSAAYNPGLWATGTVTPNGSFSVNWCDNPLNASLRSEGCDGKNTSVDFTILIIFSPGPAGTPRSQEITFVNYPFISEHYHAGNVSTATGPNGVSVTDLGAKAASFLPSSLPVELVAVLAVVTVVALAWRRKLDA